MATAAWIRGPLIGRGASAGVSLASVPSTGYVFAVKSAPLSQSALLQQEQSILCSFDSPYILSCLGSDISPESNGALFYNLFLEYASGGSLADEIKRRGGHLGEAEARSRAHDILSGLSHLHNAGVAHCDLKPGNVLIGSEGRAKIADLGCAQRMAGGESGIRGSPMYMAPEAVRGEQQGLPADVWSLGCTLIEMVTGRPPWPHISCAAEGIRRIGFTGDVPAIPDWLSDEAKHFVFCCLRRDPAERRTANELLRHPFLDCSAPASNCADLNWVSPKSVLYQTLWDAAEEEEEEVEEGEEDLFDEAAARRISGLASGAASPNWAWGEDWVDVRSAAEDCVTQIEAAGASGSDEMGIGGGTVVLGDDIVWNGSCEFCGHFQMLCFGSKLGTVRFCCIRNQDGHSLVLSNGSFLVH